MRHYRRNADDKLRDLERRAAGGDPEAGEALFRERVRSGFFDQAADVLISQSMGQLPIPLIHKLHKELMRYDLMEKLPVWTVELEEDPHPDELVGIFGTRLRALEAAASSGANAAARSGMNELAERIEIMINEGLAYQNKGRNRSAVTRFSSAVAAFNDGMNDAGVFSGLRVARAAIE